MIPRPRILLEDDFTMNRFTTRINYGNKPREVDITENSLDEVLEAARTESFKEGEVVYITQIIATVLSEQPEFTSEVIFFNEQSNLIESK
jgi:hypothetical protein